MSKKIIKRITGILLMIIALLLFVNVMEEYVTKRNDVKSLMLRGYYMEDKNTVDVVVLGASEVMLGWSAPEVYKTCGVTSYPIAFPSNPVRLWKYELKEIERTQNPKVLVVDINGALYTDESNLEGKGSFRRLAEAMPLSKNKVEMIFEFAENPLECLFPIMKYHDNWTEFPMSDLKDILVMQKRGYALLRGAQTNLYREKITEYPYYPKESETMDLNPGAEEDLREFIKACKESSIENIVFLNYTHITESRKSYERQMRCNRAWEIISEENMEYIDLDNKREEIGLNIVPDFFDKHHMNAPGQRKFSNYLGRYLVERYGLKPTELSDKQKAQWEESVDYINRFYRYFDEYVEAHADEPYKEEKLMLMDRAKPIELLSNMDGSP